MKVPKGFEKYGLRPPGSMKKYYMVVTGEGGPGSGKSRFALATAPEPVLCENLDKNLDGMEERLMDRNILIQDVKMPARIDQDADMEMFDDVKACVLDGLEGGHFRTCVIDEGGALYELCRRGFFGALGFGEVKQPLYAVSNGNMRKFFRVAKESRTNLFIPHRLKDERKKTQGKNGKDGSETTGNLIMDGWHGTKYESQVHVLFEKEDNWECGRTKCQDKKLGCLNPEVHRLDRFSMEIRKCTPNEAVEGIKLYGKNITWENLGHLVYPKSEDIEGAWR